jgi:hypothetical protein
MNTSNPLLIVTHRSASGSTCGSETELSHKSHLRAMWLSAATSHLQCGCIGILYDNTGSHFGCGVCLGRHGRVQTGKSAVTQRRLNQFLFNSSSIACSPTWPCECCGSPCGSWQWPRHKTHLIPQNIGLGATGRCLTKGAAGHRMLLPCLPPSLLASALPASGTAPLAVLCLVAYHHQISSDVLVLFRPRRCVESLFSLVVEGCDAIAFVHPAAD